MTISAAEENEKMYEEYRIGAITMSDRTEYISREAAVSICDNAIDLWNGQLGAGALVAVRDAIKALPSACARWEYVDYGGIGNWHCSACRAISHKRTNFCPACGRDMRGDYQ